MSAATSNLELLFSFVAGGLSSNDAAMEALDKAKEELEALQAALVVFELCARDLEAAAKALGDGWFAGDVTLAVAIQRKTAKLEELAEKLEAERDAARATNTRLNRRCQTYEAAIRERVPVGSDGKPKGSALSRALLNAFCETLKAQAEGLCDQLAEAVATITLANETNTKLLTIRSELQQEVSVLEARVARYEGPGPTLLAAEHTKECGVPPPADACTCGAESRADGYLEQHGRCLARIEEMAERAERNAKAVHRHAAHFKRDAEVIREVWRELRGEAATS